MIFSLHVHFAEMYVLKNLLVKFILLNINLLKIIIKDSSNSPSMKRREVNSEGREIFLASMCIYVVTLTHLANSVKLHVADLRLAILS